MRAWDYYATATLNTDNVQRLYTEAEAADLKRQYKEYLWTQEKMLRWFELEQTYGNEEFRKHLEAARKRLLQEYENMPNFIKQLPRQQRTWYRRQFRIYLLHLDAQRLDRDLAPTIVQQAAGARQALLDLKALHDEAHVATIVQFNRLFGGGPKLKDIKFYGKPIGNDWAKPFTSVVEWEDGTRTFLEVEAVRGSHTAQRVEGPKGTEKIPRKPSNRQDEDEHEK